MNMTCANKDCSAELKYLRGGRLFLMERKPLVQTISPGNGLCQRLQERFVPDPCDVSVCAEQAPRGHTALLLVVRTLLANLFDPPLD